MTRADVWKLIAVLAATLLSAWYLYPSYRYYTLSPAQRAAMPALQLSDLRKKAIHLGLDLQGGMHLVLEVDSSHLGAAEAKDAPDRAMEIIRNRIDQFGVAEPLVQSHFLALESSAFMRTEELPAVQKLLATPGLDSIVPGDSQLLWGQPDASFQGVSGRALYVVKREPEMTGGSVASAVAQLGLDQTNPGAWGVSMKLSPKGRADFARVTGNNVGRLLAIVLDGQISSAPNIHEKIPSGSASITGSFDVQSSRDLAIVLRAGALPAPVRIIEERSVGPSLGTDSIREGVTAGVIGTAMVVVFMALYYQLSGLIAIVAMVLNVFYLIACMAGFGATLTLPGIAGIVLTIGMSVDANVLIFERIREEMRNQKTIRQSVQLGYDRAFRTILDAHVTTLISAFFLFGFGTGPIKGFAVTLSIGLIANMFTAVLFTRMIFDYMLSRGGKVERLSI